MGDCTEEINKIKERFDLYITNFDDSFFKEDTNELNKNFQFVDSTGKEISNIEKKNIACLHFKSSSSQVQRISDTSSIITSTCPFQPLTMKEQSSRTACHSLFLLLGA